MKISFCVSLKNRCKVKNGKDILRLFPNSVESLNKLKESR